MFIFFTFCYCSTRIRRFSVSAVLHFISCVNFCVYFTLPYLNPEHLQNEQLSVYNEPSSRSALNLQHGSEEKEFRIVFRVCGVGRPPHPPPPKKNIERRKTERNILSPNANILSSFWLTWLLGLTRFTFVAGHHCKFLQRTPFPPQTHTHTHKHTHINSVFLLFYFKHCSGFLFRPPAALCLFISFHGKERIRNSINRWWRALLWSDTLQLLFKKFAKVLWKLQSLFNVMTVTWRVKSLITVIPISWKLQSLITIIIVS